MNILFISWGLSPTVGGTERVTRVLMKHFEELGHQCYITYCTGDDASFPAEKKLFVNYRAKYAFLKSQLDDFAQKAKADVIINENVCETEVSRWLREVKAAHSSMPVIYCLHNTPELFVRNSEKLNAQAIKNKLFKLFTGDSIYMWKHRKMYNVADRYVVLSPSYIQRFMQIFRLKDDGKVIAVPNPISVHAAETDSTQKENLFLIIARLSEKQKNIKAALRIWKRFSVSHSDYKLIIAGYGDDEQMLRDYAKELGLERCEFVGKTTEPQKYYARAKFFMMTSLYEGFPMTIVEALQHQCIPIVFDSFAAIHDIIDDGENGILVSAFDEDKYVDSMTRLVADDQLQESLRSNTLPSLNKFTIEKVGERWMEVIKELIK